MKNQLLDSALSLLEDQHFDSLAVGVIDFKNQKFESFEISATNVVSEKPYLYFDLASLTKVLTNSAVRLKSPEVFDEKSNLLLNHIAGLPSGGLLSKKTWREEILAYDVKLSPTLYSDYSSLRCMLEIEKKSGKKLKELCSYYFDPELVHWMELPENAFSPEYGIRNKQVISGQVHDNNCFNIAEFVSHAGLFATIDGLCRSLINLNQKASMNEQLLNAFKTHKNEDRFIMGFDHVMDPENTLAGKGATTKTFGHLGFTGTSFWINPETNIGAVILTNATQTYWYERSGLIKLKKSTWCCYLEDVMNSISSAIVAIGVALAGFFIGNGIIQFKKLDRVVEVKGLSERIVDSNEARWSLTVNAASDNMMDLNKKTNDIQAATLAFLEAQGFSKEEIQKDAGNITDKEAQEYGERKGARFVYRGGFVVTSNKIDKLVLASQKTDELLRQGVALSSSRISYFFTDLNSIKPKMLEESTKNAKAAAQSFAVNAGAKVGDIKNASQGLFSIGSPISDYDSETSLKKKVRVVSQVVFYLE